MSWDIEKIMKEYHSCIENISEGHVKRMILYGSYARGDYRKDSDIDIMVLLDVKGSSLKEYEDRIYDLTYNFNEEHETEIMPIVQNIEHFDYWKNAYMFYSNVESEGVAI